MTTQPARPAWQPRQSREDTATLTVTDVHVATSGEADATVTTDGNHPIRYTVKAWRRRDIHIRNYDTPVWGWRMNEDQKPNAACGDLYGPPDITTALETVCQRLMTFGYPVTSPVHAALTAILTQIGTDNA